MISFPIWNSRFSGAKQLGSVTKTAIETDILVNSEQVFPQGWLILKKYKEKNKVFGHSENEL